MHGGKGVAGTGSDRFSSMGFSSTSEAGPSDSDGKSMISSRSRRSEAERERLPKLVETLALCYLGTLLMRLPTSIGEIYLWAAREEIVFSRAVSGFANVWSITNIQMLTTVTDQGDTKRDACTTPRPSPYGIGNQGAVEGFNSSAYYLSPDQIVPFEL